MVWEDRIKSEPTITLSMEREQSDQTVVVKLEDSVLHKIQSLSNRSFVFNLELADFGTSLPVPGSVATLSIRGNEVGIVDGTDSQIPKVLLIETDLLTRLCREQPDLRLQFVDIITETRDNLLFLEMLDPGDFPTDLEPVKQRSCVDVPQMHPTVVTACQNIGCHNLEGRQLLVVVIERDHVLDMAPSPVLLPKEMTLAEELPVRDIGRERLGDIEIELALDDVQSESLPDELVRRCAIEQSTCQLAVVNVLEGQATKDRVADVVRH